MVSRRCESGAWMRSQRIHDTRIRARAVERGLRNGNASPDAAGHGMLPVRRRGGRDLGLHNRQ
jgi:hypothetical protein